MHEAKYKVVEFTADLIVSERISSYAYNKIRSFSSAAPLATKRTSVKSSYVFL